MLATQLRLDRRPVAGAFGGYDSMALDFGRREPEAREATRRDFAPPVLRLDSKPHIKFSPGAIGLASGPRVEFSAHAVRRDSGPRGSSQRTQQHPHAATRRAAQYISN